MSGDMVGRQEEVFPEASLVKITEEEYTARALMGEDETFEFSDIDEVHGWARSLGQEDG